jgi:hypothetical protein
MAVLHGLAPHDGLGGRVPRGTHYYDSAARRTGTEQGPIMFAAQIWPFSAPPHRFATASRNARNGGRGAPVSDRSA